MRRPQALLRITLASVALNAALNWGFIHGTFGLPELGLTGIGVATSGVHLLSFLALHTSVRRDTRLAPLLRLDFWRADAHTAVNQLIYIVFQVAVGLSHAASINVSRELALGDHPAARRIKNTALVCGAVVTTIVGILCLAAPHMVLRPYFDPHAPADQQGRRIATGLLVIVAVLQSFDCAQNIGVGLLRGLDDTRSGFRVTLIGYWAVGPPTSWLLAYPLGGGTRGLWLGLLCGLATTAVLLLRRYSRALDAREAAPLSVATA